MKKGVASMSFTELTYHQLSEQQISYGIRFLFPDLTPSSTIYKKLHQFIENEYKRLGTCVLCANREIVNDEFPDLMKSLNLPSIGKKEVIVNEASVQVTEDYQIRPETVFSREVPK